jgi:hypothetical protein
MSPLADKSLVLATVFGLSMIASQSQNHQSSAATLVVLLNRRNQIQIKIRSDPTKS